MNGMHNKKQETKQKIVVITVEKELIKDGPMKSSGNRHNSE